ncbi:MAG: hypothetical protein EA372_02595, partial [Chromatiaceae bacterium]
MAIAIALPLALPTLLALLMVLPKARPFIWRLMPLAALPALALALLAPMPLSIRGEWLLMGATFGLDEVARLFLGFTAVLWIAAGAAAREWFSGTPGGRTGPWRLDSRSCPCGRAT